MNNSTYSSTLTISHPTFNRNGASSMFYYEALQLTVSAAGSYRLRSVSIVDTYGYLYLSSFFPSNVATNLIAQDDDSAGSVQFLLVYTLQPGTTYVLVFTTFSPSTTTAFSVIGSGPSPVRFNRSSVISTTSSTRTTSSIGGTSSIRTTSAQTTVACEYMFKITEICSNIRSYKNRHSFCVLLVLFSSTRQFDRHLCDDLFARWCGFKVVRLFLERSKRSEVLKTCVFS